MLTEKISTLLDAIPAIAFCKTSDARFLGCTRKFAMEELGLKHQNDIISMPDMDLPCNLPELALQFKQEDENALRGHKQVALNVFHNAHAY